MFFLTFGCSAQFNSELRTRTTSVWNFLAQNVHF